MSDDLTTESSPWFLGLALLGASGVMMTAMAAITVLGVVWLFAGAPAEDASIASDEKVAELPLTDR